MDASFCYGYRLLFHGFMNGYLVRDIHLVKLVNGAYTVVRKHQGTSLDGKVTCFLVFDDRCCETGGGGRLSRSVDCAGQEGTNVPEIPHWLVLVGQKGNTHFRNCDLDVDGSPMMQILMSPRKCIPSPVCLCTPPINCSSSPFFTIS